MKYGEKYVENVKSYPQNVDNFEKLLTTFKKGIDTTYKGGMCVCNYIVTFDEIYRYM